LPPSAGNQSNALDTQLTLFMRRAPGSRKTADEFSRLAPEKSSPAR
jgi:hypothetical protein